MKKWLCALMCLCLLLASMPAALAEAGEGPAIGDVVHGFEAIEARDFPMIDAKVTLFEHQKTGARLVYIANGDVNRVFDLTFLTVAENNTGLPHVFEHSTLDGSEKYPSKALFFNLSNQTYNSFMNAMTYHCMTTYPIASLSEAQLLKYADYYTDSCLNPMVMEDESIFREEAWRYRLMDPEAELTLEGTVYSEMLGATTLERAASLNAARQTWPGSNMGNDSGGAPDSIPDMTWDDVKAYHDTYYHPSNCVAFLYGDFEEYEAFLALLDEAFAPYEKREHSFEDAGYAPLSGEVTAEYPFPVEAGSNTENASTIYYSIVLPELDEEGIFHLDTLTSLLNAEACALQQNLQRALPSGSFDCEAEFEPADRALMFVASSVNPEDADTFRQVVDDSLRQIAEEGFPQDLVDGVMTSLSIEMLLTPEDPEVGVNLIADIAYNYAAVYGDIWGYMDYVDALGNMDDWNRQGVYAAALTDWLANSPARTLVTTYPEPGLKEQNDAALAERLAQVKAGMTDGEIAALVEASNAVEETEDTSEYVAALTAVDVASLPEELKAYEISDMTDDSGVRHIEVLAGVDGIGNASILLDASGIPQELLPWFKLYTNLVGNVATRRHTKAEVATLMGRYLYEGKIYLSVPDSPDSPEGFNPYMRMNWIALDEDLEKGYELMGELALDTDVEDAAGVLEYVQGCRAELRDYINNNSLSVQLRRAMAVTQDEYRYYTCLTDLEYYDFLCQAEELLAEDPQTAVDSLMQVQALLNNRQNAVSLFAGNAESIALNRGLADAFLGGLDQRPIEPAAYDLPAPAASEGLIVDSAVQYNGVYADPEALGMAAFDGGYDAVAMLVDDVFLLPLLRDQYGAYGAYSAITEDDGAYVYSYRDPNVAETFEVYDGLYDMLAALNPDQQTLDGYIMAAYSEYATPKGELTGAVSAAVDVLEGKDPTRNLGYMAQLKALSPEKVAESAELFKNLMEKGVRFTSGAASAINANADLYEAILNPLGAVDLTQVELSDVGEDDPRNEAVRYALENGYMGLVSEDAFGVDEPATVGDAMAAMYVMIGGPLDGEEATAFFADYGLSAGGAEDPITEAQAAQALSDFATLVELEWSMEGAGDAPLTRGDLAALLMRFDGDLE